MRRPDLPRIAVTIAIGVLCAVPAAAQTTQRRGAVTDSATGAPIAGARIEATGGGTTRIAFTDEQGRYLLAGGTGVPMGIRVTRIGYRPRLVHGGTNAGTDVALAAIGMPMDPVVVSASRSGTTESAAPTATSLVDRRQMQDRVALSSIEQVRATPGIDVATKGLTQHSYAVRGERGSVSGALLTLTDHRNADVPSLGLNIPYLLAATAEDLDRIEVARGPGAALYGPGADRGVVHFITRSPFESRGATWTMTSGERGLFGVSGRWAGLLGSRVALKLSGDYLQGRDWQFTDSVEAFNRAAVLPATTRPDTVRIGLREPGLSRVGGEARLDWRPDARTEVVATAGLAEAIHNVELGGDLGSVQVRRWRYGFAQARMQRDRLFANVFFNRSGTGDSYFLRTGQPVVDSSRVFAAQLQHGRFVGPIDLLYGADARWTDPRTGGTINGENEHRDRLFEVGGYLHGTAALTPKLEAVAALRADHHSRLRDFVLSPRLGLVYHPTPTHAFRVTFNRAFTSPDANTLALDLVADASLAPLYYVRASSVPDGGYTFPSSCGGPCMHSPFAPGTPLSLDATQVWPGLVAFLQTQGIDISGVPQPNGTQIGTNLALLDPVAGSFAPASVGSIGNVPVLGRTMTTAFEVGWKGRFRRHDAVSVDLFVSSLKNVIGSRYSITPNAFLDPAALQAYLTPYVGAAQAAQLTAAIAPIPMGVITPMQTTHPGDMLVLSRQGGRYTLFGIDLGYDIQVTSRLTARGSLSWVNRNTATDPVIGSTALGIPRRKTSLGMFWRDDARSLGAGLSGRWVDGFEVNTGVYQGYVRSYSVVDAHLDVALPFSRRTTLAVEAQNILGRRHQEFVGAPFLGRLLLVRLRTHL